MTMRRIAGVLAVLSLIAGSCSHGTVASTAPPSSEPPITLPSSPPSPLPSPPSPSPPPTLASVRVRLAKVATLVEPVAMAVRAGDDGLFVVEKTGKIVVIRGGKVEPKALLDISGQVSKGNEQGLLGLAFSPDGSYLYVDYTDVNGDTRVREYAMSGDQVKTGSARQVLFVDQPYSNHNGGNLVFGPDGYLYVGLGDGGSGGDPQGNGQSLSTLLGKILRIAPRAGGGYAYGIPSDNPFADKAGARQEIWAYGLRNPWRFSFDRATGDLWIGDVGQRLWEEIDFQPSHAAGGRNYGWNRLEGTHPYSGSAPAGAVGPIYEYPHSSGGCAVVGGYVYRGSAILGLGGAYVFGDYCSGTLTALLQKGGKLAQRMTLDVEVPALSAFGEDANGELYAMSFGGALYKIVPA